MIVTRISDGLGNQLFQYAAGRSLATRLQTSLGFDVSPFGYDLSRRYELHHFRVRERVISHAHKTLIRLSTSPRLQTLRGVLRAVLPDLSYTHFRDENAGYDPAFASLAGNIYLDGYWQSEKYFTAVANDLRREFTLRDVPDEQNQQALRRIAAVPHAVCLHVRRGDYLSNPTYRAKYHVCSLDYYTHAIQAMRARTADPVFFVFSDDPEWARENLPLERQAEFINFNVGRQDHEDLRLMAACRHFIIANSTFSWWGAWLGADPDKLVIAPRQWFASNEQKTDDLIPDSWMRL